MNNQHDRYAKSLWIKVYQDVLNLDLDSEDAKDAADLAVAHYMDTFGTESTQNEEDFVTESGQVVKENFTADKLTKAYVNSWADREAKAKKELAQIRNERDNYYDRLQELRAEKAQLIEVPFNLDDEGDIVLHSKNYFNSSLYGYCKDNSIDQKRIKRIWLEMKSEEE